MYAAILTENEVNFADIKDALNKRGWAVFSKGIEQLDQTPSKVAVWILYAWKSLGYPKFPLKSYVRIGSETPQLKAHFYPVNCGWIGNAYFQPLIWLSVNWVRAKRLLRKASNHWIGKM